MTCGLPCSHCVTHVFALFRRPTVVLASLVYAAMCSTPLERPETTVDLDLLRSGLPCFESQAFPGAMNQILCSPHPQIHVEALPLSVMALGSGAFGR